MVKTNECYFQYDDDCYLNVNADPAVASASGSVTVTVVRHPKGSAETFKSFSWDRGMFIRNFAAVEGSTADVATECIVPSLLRRAYDDHVKALQG